MRLILLVIISIPLIAQPQAAPMPTPEIQYLDQNGQPLAGAFLCSFIAGTGTPQDTYTDSSALTANKNPIVLDSYGRASVWVKQQNYKFVLYTGGNGLCPGTGVVQWSQDNVLAIFQQVNSINGLMGAVTLAGTANQVIITPSLNTLTFSLPQSIAPTSTPIFSGMTISGLLNANGGISESSISVVDTSRNINGNSYSVNGSGISDNASNISGHSYSLYGVGTPLSDNVGNIAGHSLTINDVGVVIDSAGNAAVHNLGISGACAGCPAGPPTGQSTGGRALNTVYQNTGTTPRYINVDVNLSASSTLNCVTDNSSTPVVVAGGAGTPGTIALLRETVTFIVLPGNYYEAKIIGTVTLNNWMEWQ